MGIDIVYEKVPKLLVLLNIKETFAWLENVQMSFFILGTHIVCDSSLIICEPY